MKTINIKCKTCGNLFEKQNKEYNRKIRNGKTDFYCSLSCSGKSPKQVERLITVGAPYLFNSDSPSTKLVTDSELLESSMKEMTRRVRRRKKHFQHELSSQVLIDVWNGQKGKCKYTNVNLVLPRYPKYKTTSNNYKVSLDRIDSSKPYSYDNIQFTSVTVNLAKSTMSETELLEFFKLIQGPDWN